MPNRVFISAQIAYDNRLPTNPIYPMCPECGKECEVIFKNEIGIVMGCDQCLKRINAWEYQREKEEGTA